MIVILSDEFRVNITTDNHILEVYEDTVDKTTQATKQTWKLVGYFPNMVQCVNRAAQYKVASNNETQRFTDYVELLQKTLDQYAKTAKS